MTIEANTPAQEPTADLLERAPFDDDSTHPETVDDNQKEINERAQRAALPFWIAEKFHWKTSGTGRSYLSPNPEFLAAIEEDAFKAAQFGVTLVEKEDSQEQANVEQLVSELTPVKETLKAIDERELTDFTRWLVERATRNACYAAITQFELTSWAARAAAGGKDAHDHENFGTKEARMETFASTAGVYFKVVKSLLPDADLDVEVYAKMARRLIYQQADMNTRDQLNPAQISENEQAKVEAAVTGVKRF